MTIAERLEQKGRNEGLQEGRQEGAAEKAQAIARQLRNMGMTPEQIEQATGLSGAELKNYLLTEVHRPLLPGFVFLRFILPLPFSPVHFPDE